MNNLDFKVGINFLETEQIREFITLKMDQKRLFHTLATEHEAVRLYNIYYSNLHKSENETKLAKIKSAALLHDITKELTMEEHYTLCQKYSIILTDHDKKVEKSLHAKTAAYVAKFEFGADNEVFSAIYSHTFGSVSMTLFDKILYLSDYIEETRSFVDCIKVRSFFCNGIEVAKTEKEKYNILDKALLYSFNLTISSLIEENHFIHSATIESRNALL